MESCSCIQIGMEFTEPWFAKSSGNEGDPNQTVIHDVAGDAESKLGGEDEDSYN